MTARPVDEQFALLYDELRRIARRQRRRHLSADTLRTTALVHEAYLRLRDTGRFPSLDPSHFLALSARAMRFVLVDYARSVRAGKRGGGEVPEPFDEDLHAAAADGRAGAVLALHEALDRLGERNDRMARVVECRFFGGMTETEIAEALGVSERTVRGDWERARLWLGRDLMPQAHGRA